MKIGATRRRRKNPALDLFGEVAVTLDDVELWLDAVPKIPRDHTWRRAYYARTWDVVGKVAAAKLAGEFDAIVAHGLAEVEALRLRFAGRRPPTI